MLRAFLAATLLVLPACGGPVPVVPSDGGLDLNDVSFLFPLPAPGHEGDLLPLKDALLPHALYAGLPLLVEGADPAVLETELRVVSARVDPCFPGSTPPAAAVCLRQVRLVAQPVRTSGPDAGFVETTDDATLHLFFTLDATAFATVKDGLQSLKARAGAETDHAPLDVHPVMKREGLSGPYARELKALLTTHCRPQALSRIAFQSLAGGGGVWTFGAFDVVGGELKVDPIPRLGPLTAQSVQDFGSPQFRSQQLLPTVSGDDLDVLLSESQMRLTDERTLKRALTSALQKEHPARSSPKTVDCASCHVASRARSNAEAQRRVDTSAWPDAFTAHPRFDLRRVDGAANDPRAVRAFGYFGALSALSQRTINESAEVATALSGP